MTSSPEGDLRELACERRQDHLQVFGKNGICLDPLHKHASGREMRPRFAIKLTRKQAGDAGDPGVRGLRNYQVILSIGGEQKTASVIDDDVHARVIQHPTIERREIGSRMKDSRLYLDEIDLLNFGIASDRRYGHSAAKADDKHPLQMGMKDSAQVPQNQLRPRIARGSVGFSIGA